MVAHCDHIVPASVSSYTVSMKKFSIILKNIVVIIIATFFTLLLLEIFSRNFIKKVPTKIFHFDKNALIWDQEIGSHAFKKPSKSIMTNGHYKEYVFIDKNGFRVNSTEENITNPEIITIGDSQTFGHGISNNDTWPNFRGIIYFVTSSFSQ